MKGKFQEHLLICFATGTEVIYLAPGRAEIFGNNTHIHIKPCGF